jgi:hypothetical protein
LDVFRIHGGIGLSKKLYHQSEMCDCQPAAFVTGPGRLKEKGSEVDKFSPEDFERFEKRARKLGLTPSQLLEKHLTGDSPEEVKGDFTPIPYPKPPPGNIKRRRLIE